MFYDIIPMHLLSIFIILVFKILRLHDYHNLQQQKIGSLLNYPFDVNISLNIIQKNGSNYNNWKR